MIQGETGNNGGAVQVDRDQYLQCFLRRRDSSARTCSVLMYMVGNWTVSKPLKLPLLVSFGTPACSKSIARAIRAPCHLTMQSGSVCTLMSHAHSLLTSHLLVTHAGARCQTCLRQTASNPSGHCIHSAQSNRLGHPKPLPDSTSSLRSPVFPPLFIHPHQPITHSLTHRVTHSLSPSFSRLLLPLSLSLPPLPTLPPLPPPLPLSLS